MITQDTTARVFWCRGPLGIEACRGDIPRNDDVEGRCQATLDVSRNTRDCWDPLTETRNHAYCVTWRIELETVG